MAVFSGSPGNGATAACCRLLNCCGCASQGIATAEKMLPHGRRAGAATGFALIALGIVVASGNNDGIGPEGDGRLSRSEGLDWVITSGSRAGRLRYQQALWCFERKSSFIPPSTVMCWTKTRACCTKLQGHLKQAHDVLASTDAWFTEHTRDLQEAKILLARCQIGDSRPKYG